ncbi:unnamed protein product, partial [Gulo gulo]
WRGGTAEGCVMGDPRAGDLGRGPALVPGPWRRQAAEARRGQPWPRGGRGRGAKGVPSFHSSETNLSEDWCRSVAM